MEETATQHTRSIQSRDPVRLKRDLEQIWHREEQYSFEDPLLASDTRENWKERRDGKYDKIERDVHIYYYLSRLFHSQCYNLQSMSRGLILHLDKNPRKS